MASPELVDFARNFSVMVRVKGPDPKGLKMRNHAFHQYNSGITTVSASGFLLPERLYDGEAARELSGESDRKPGLVVTVASVVEQFLSLEHRDSLVQGKAELIAGVEIDIMAEVEAEGPPCWFAAQLLTLIDVPSSAVALQSLLDASISSPEHRWEVGWSLASNNNPQSVMDVTHTQVRYAAREFGNTSVTGKSTTRVAILGISLFPKDIPNITISSSNKRGDFLVAVGSPFGILSPLHFFNCISVGSIANCHPPNSSFTPLLMADIRCLPGVEGGPVLSENAQLIGMLIRPLRQKTSGAEVQLVISWEAIASACSDLLHKEPRYADKGIYYDKGNLNAVGKAFSAVTCGSNGPIKHTEEHLSTSCSTSVVEKATASVCLITVDDGVWASGVFLNKQGLILTNAHLLEPWRFGKRPVTDGHITDSHPILSEGSPSPHSNGVNGEQKIQGFLSGLQKSGYASVDDEDGALNSSYKGHRGIRVRLDHVDPWIWCDAQVVYVCKGPLDVALLQIKYIPDHLSPIVVDASSPSLGSKTFVIGHGLFGPRCGFSPSICSGVVTKVVKAKYQPSQSGHTLWNSPVMLETTAAVHPGGSGGAVVNSVGHMIGLVTSNARHGGGTVIPHLNFSIPCAALLPIFKFSKDMQDLSLLQVLDQPNEHLSSVWALTPYLSPKPHHLLHMQESVPNDHGKEVKGSRFAKFIAERRDVFPKPTQLNRAGRLLNDIVPSKL